MQFTHATRSPRASQIAGRVVYGSKVDIVAGISARDSVAMEKSFLQLVFEVLYDATATLVQLPDCRPPHSLYTLASEPQPSVRESCVVRASSDGLCDGTIKRAPSRRHPRFGTSCPKSRQHYTCIYNYQV